jgi:flagellar hook-length control protein FliK
VTMPTIATPAPAPTRPAGTGCPSGHAAHPRGDDAESFASVLEQSRGDAGRAPANRDADTAERADRARAEDVSAPSAAAGQPPVGAVNAAAVPGAPAQSAVASVEASGNTNVAAVPTQMTTGATGPGNHAPGTHAPLPSGIGAATVGVSTVPAAGSPDVPTTSAATAPAASAVPGTTAVPPAPDSPTALSLAAGTGRLDPTGSPSLAAAADAIATRDPLASSDTVAAADTGGPAEAPVPAATQTVAAPPPPPVSADTTTGEAPGAAPAPPATQVAMHLVPLRRDADGIHRLTVHLHPADLGMVSLVAEIRDGEVHLQLVGATEAGRDALRDALPALRRELQQGGFSQCSLDLGQNAPHGGHAHRGEPTGWARSTSGPPAVTHEPAVAEATPTTTPSDRRLDLRI